MIDWTCRCGTHNALNRRTCESCGWRREHHLREALEEASLDLQMCGERRAARRARQALQRYDGDDAPVASSWRWWAEARMALHGWVRHLGGWWR